jgi:adenosylmethionine-8-amino-7-oxononanoate aminotransferase
MEATHTQLRQWDVDHLWHPFTQMAEYAQEDPLVIERAHGCYLVDTHGNEYFDGVSSLWCNVHGHRHPKLDAAVRAQLDRVAHSTLLGVSSVPAIQLARKLAEIAPPGLTRVFFSDDGATAVEVALKMAFQYWQQRPDPRPRKTKFLALGGAYHGDTLGAVSVGGVELFHRMFQPLLNPALRAPSPHCYRCPLGLERSQCQIDCLAELERIVATHHDEIAAVVIEPLVQGAAGMIVAPDGYLRGVRDATARHDVLLIADEVAVGFGRTGTMFACQQESVVPDLLCLAKGLTAGYLPLAATLATDEIYSAFLGTHAQRKTFFHGHTYSGNPLGAAVALANLELFESEQVLAHLPPKVETLKHRLAGIAQLDHVGDVRQKGLIAAIELVRDPASKQPFDRAEQIGPRVCRHARNLGLLIRPLGDVLVLMPPLAVSTEQIDLMCNVVEKSIRAVTAHADQVAA